MAKEKSDKTSQYLLLIVGIVALVGFVVLILNSSSSSLSSADLTGQALKGTKLTPKILLPDFAVKSIVKTGFTNADDTVTIQIEVENKGKSAAAINEYMVWIGEGTGGWGNIFTDTDKMAAGSSKVLEVTFPVGSEWLDSIMAGEVDEMTWRVMLDVGNAVTESDETNNEFVETK